MTDDILRKRYWLLNNIDWFLDECVYHRENKINYNDKKTLLWILDTAEGRAKIE